jgi:hypothetical protein
MSIDELFETENTLKEEIRGFTDGDKLIVNEDNCHAYFYCIDELKEVSNEILNRLLKEKY